MPTSMIVTVREWSWGMEHTDMSTQPLISTHRETLQSRKSSFDRMEGKNTEFILILILILIIY